MDPSAPDAARGVYGISVAAELVGMGVQALRLYEERGLLAPARTSGGTRRYSADDLDRLRRIGELLGAGLNLAGIARVLDLETDNARLREHNEQLLDEKEDRWPSSAPGPRRTSQRPTPSSSGPPSTTPTTARRRTT